MSTITDPEPDYVARRFLVSGKVQGVYFRHSTRLEAPRLGLRGVARNLPDGTVEVVAHGPPGAVDALREWLGVGPPMAEVATVREFQAQADTMAAAVTGAHFSVE
jgi:acylphosphatase